MHGSLGNRVDMLGTSRYIHYANKLNHTINEFAETCIRFSWHKMKIGMYGSMALWSELKNHMKLN